MTEAARRDSARPETGRFRPAPTASLASFGSWALLFALLAGALPAAAQTSPSVPVRVGGDWEFAACTKRGTVNASEGREFVPVNSTPTPSMRPIGRLPVGTEVYLCDENGTFVGVVYGDGDCGLDEPIERRAAYRGACASGWVHNRSIDRSDGGAV